MPSDPKVTEAFKKVWEKTSPSLSIPQGNAIEVLTGTAGSFFDPELAGWIGEKAAEMKGEDAPYAQAAAISMLMKVARKKEWATVELLSAKKITYPKVSTVGKAYEKELEKLKKAVDEFNEDVACWEKKLTASSSQQKANQIVGIKAGYMLAAAGDEGRKKLAAAIPRISNDAIRFVAVAAVDRLSPKGDKALADQFQALIDKATEQRDKKKLQAYEPLKTVIYRLQARAQ